MPIIPTSSSLQKSIIPLMLAITCLALAAANQHLDSVLAFDRTAIEQGEWWRIITANFLQLNWKHLALNLAGIIGIWFIFWGEFTKRWELLFLLISVISTTALLFFLSPNVKHYVGLSGALHGIFIAFCIASIRQHSTLSAIGIIGISIKLLNEQFLSSNSLIEQFIESSVIIDSHLWGAFGGFIAGGIYLFTSINSSDDH
ncbi:MAG: rhombosortase [Cellvibrionaceae bacterium]